MLEGTAMITRNATLGARTVSGGLRRKIWVDGSWKPISCHPVDSGKNDGTD